MRKKFEERAGTLLEQQFPALPEDKKRMLIAYLIHNTLGLGDLEMAVGTLRAALDLSPGDHEVADALAHARMQLRLRLGWPLAIPPAAIAAGLLTWALLLRRRVKAARS